MRNIVKLTVDTSEIHLPRPQDIVALKIGVERPKRGTGK